MKEGRENLDPTKELRKELCYNLRFYAQSDAELQALEQFEKGSFLFPSHTTNTIKELLMIVASKGENPMEIKEIKRLQELYDKIIREGL
ncbi:MAG: hypothetical protein Q7R94_00175 [bacterium]|nr:hypothetical protein [bacterium]